MERKKLALEDIALSEEYFIKIEEGQWSNQIIAEFCSVLAELEEDRGIARYWELRESDLKYCHKTLVWNHYQQQAIKDFQRTFKCHDRFCPLCAKDVANRREQKFSQALEDIGMEYDLFHLSMTLPNCRGSVAPWGMPEKVQKLKGLTETIKQMSKCFCKFNRYLKSDAKIRGIDFSQYGYAGAIRSLETTFFMHREYHPHFHVILALKKDVQLPGENINKFSWDRYSDSFHPFTDFEILIQKIWYLIINNETVTKTAIDNLKLGYSCHMRKIDKDGVHEAFKYAIKPDEGENMTLNVFQDLNDALFKKRTVETYGVFRKYKFSDEEIDESFDVFYDELVKAWQTIELPVIVSESTAEARDNIKKKLCLYASRKSVRSFVRRLGLDEELPAIVAEPKRMAEFAQMMMELPEVLKTSKQKPKFDADGRRERRNKNATRKIL